MVSRVNEEEADEDTLRLNPGPGRVAAPLAEPTASSQLQQEPGVDRRQSSRKRKLNPKYEGYGYISLASPLLPISQLPIVRLWTVPVSSPSSY